MGSGAITKRAGNKVRRQELHVQHKRQNEKDKREARFRRKKEEARDPELRQARVAKNIPASIDKKRVWDDVDDDSLGAIVDMAQLMKKRRLQQVEAEEKAAAGLGSGDDDDDDDDAKAESGNDEENDSMLGSDDENSDSGDDEDEDLAAKVRAKRAMREDSTAASTTSTNLDITPEALVARFPTLFSDDRPAEPKILVTTNLNSTLHDEAHLLCTLFPNSQYIPRSAHKYAHKYSVREISKFATNRGYTAVVVLREDQKKPIGLDIM